MASLNVTLEVSSSVTTASEDSCSVSILVIIDHVDCLFEGVSVGDTHDGSEDFLIIALHAWLHTVEDGGSNPVAIRIAFNSSPSTIKK